jgi:hypothetical protein
MIILICVTMYEWLRLAQEDTALLITSKLQMISFPSNSSLKFTFNAPGIFILVLYIYIYTFQFEKYKINWKFDKRRFYRKKYNEKGDILASTKAFCLIVHQPNLKRPLITKFVWYPCTPHFYCMKLKFDIYIVDFHVLY